MKEFWQRDIKNASTCGTYYEHAHILQEEKIIDQATQSCTTNIMSINAASRLVHVANDDFWIKILSHSSHGDLSRDMHLSTLVAAYCRNNQVTSQTFKKLTEKESLPYISARVSFVLLDIERKLLDPDGSKLTCVQVRCIDAFAREWRRVNLVKKKDMVEILQQLHPALLTELFVRTVTSVASGSSGFSAYGYDQYGDY